MSNSCWLNSTFARWGPIIAVTSAGGHFESITSFDQTSAFLDQLLQGVFHTGSQKYFLLVKIETNWSSPILDRDIVFKAFKISVNE